MLPVTAWKGERCLIYLNKYIFLIISRSVIRGDNEADYSYSVLPSYLCYILGFIAVYSIYPVYNEKNKKGKLLTAIFAPLIGVLLKIICRTRERFPSGTFIRLYGTGIFRLSGDVSSFISAYKLFMIHGDSWNNSWNYGSLRKEHNGRIWSLLPGYFEKNISTLGKFSHSSSWETN